MLFERKRMALGVAVLAVAVAVVLVAISCSGKPAKLPTGEQVIDAYIKATGGLASYDKINNNVLKATLDIPAAGIAIDVTMYSARPNKLRSIASAPAIGTIERGTDGVIFWEKSTMQGARILEGEELTEALREVAFENIVYWRGPYDSATVAGIDTVDGSPCYKVVMKPKTGKSRTVFFDTKSGLATKSVSIATTQMGDLPVESFISDYRKVGDILQSYKTIMKVMGQERIIRAKSIEQNVAIPDSIFAIPADIQALIKKD